MPDDEIRSHSRSVDGEGPSEEFVLREMQHRAANLISVIGAIAHQTFQNAPRHQQEAFTRRLQCLARIDTLRTFSADQRISLAEMLSQTLRPFHDGSGSCVHFTGEDVALSGNDALSLGMAFHELATNALKYGALSSASGRVTISSILRDENGARRLLLQWRESGGPAVKLPAHRGGGTHMLARAVAPSRGHITTHYFEKGLSCEISIAL